VARLTALPDAHAWLSAGPTPVIPRTVLVEGDGRVSTLETPPDRPLGIGADRPRSETELVIQPGTTLILFTDGLVERRRQIIDGIRSLSSTLTDLGPPALRDPESLCGELFARLLPDSPEDDVGLLVAHLTTRGSSDRPTVRAARGHGRMRGLEQSEVQEPRGPVTPTWKEARHSAL
jgi:hypothetical protein